MSNPQQVHIIGAGIAGLVLGRALSRRGIIPILSDKGPNMQTNPRNHHGITLYPSAYRQLLPILELDEAAFRKKIAVDADVGGIGRMRAPTNNRDSDQGAGFRANRGKFERLLAEGLDVQWEKEVESVVATSDSSLQPQLHRSVEVRFKSGERWSGEDEVIIVGADGPHSSVRATVAPSVELEILPFAVYNGRRRYQAAEFQQKFGSAFIDTNVLHAEIDESRLEISIDEHTNERISLSYTYSRPGLAGEDALFRPHRSKSAAKEIPEAFFTEIQTLRKRMDAVFLEIFNAEQMREDRLLNWLMRRLELGEDPLHKAAEKGIALIGDAVHAEPILGGQGANEAIEDGIKLASAIAAAGSRGIGMFYGDIHTIWARDNRQSKTVIEGMHTHGRSSL